MATTTFYPPTNGTGYLQHSDNTALWSTKHDAASGQESEQGNPIVDVRSGDGAGDPVRNWYLITRGAISFVLTDLGENVTSAVLRIHSRTPCYNQWSSSASIKLFKATFSNPTNLADSDYNITNFETSTIISDTTLAFPFSDDAWFEFPLNAAGLAYVVNGTLSIGLLADWDADDSSPSWQASKELVAFFRADSEANRPELIVTHTDIDIQTDPATNVTSNSATLNGTLNNDGSDTPVMCSFEYGLTTNYGYTTTPATVTEGSSFSANVSSLIGGMYHFRAKAVGDSGDTIYGDDLTFSTGSPSITAVYMDYQHNMQDYPNNAIAWFGTGYI